MDFGFGAQTCDSGVRFRLWAPAAERVDVVIEDPGRERVVVMENGGRGWFEASVTGACSGTLYRYRIDAKTLVPDPASRFQPRDVDGPSQVVDEAAYLWENDRWPVGAWHETVIYEVHVGTFTSEGSYDGVRSRLNYLKDLGVTAVELMPVSDFPGSCNWGYDGVLPFAPDSVYGSSEDLKRLIDEAHGLGMTVFLDVVYNHFGPEGNYLHLYAPGFFTDVYHTPWGAAINFSVPEVREFFIANALYWLAEYRFDGLRLDAVHAIRDIAEPHILEELAMRVRAGLPGWRRVHLVLENDRNQASFLTRDRCGGCVHFEAQWNDDIHHCCHVLATGENFGYYGDYSEMPLDFLGRCLAEGFAYQGESSKHRGGKARGEISKDLPPDAFVAFLQNHDQIGNRALGERLSVLSPDYVREALVAMLLLAPQVPLLFMGEEWGTRRPFTFFCDFRGDLAKAVREGRRKEFAAFPQFTEPGAIEHIPDPNAPGTMSSAVLDWNELDLSEHTRWLELYRRLLVLRHERIVPLISKTVPCGASWRVLENDRLVVSWLLSGGKRLVMAANFGTERGKISLEETVGHGCGNLEIIYPFDDTGLTGKGYIDPGPWSVCVFLRG
jgi:maltooligosyltrehalose trehalohydrolase